jgi:hypothetical protein
VSSQETAHGAGARSWRTKITRVHTLCFGNLSSMSVPTSLTQMLSPRARLAHPRSEPVLPTTVEWSGLRTAIKYPTQPDVAALIGPTVTTIAAHGSLESRVHARAMGLNMASNRITWIIVGLTRNTTVLDGPLSGINCSLTSQPQLSLRRSVGIPDPSAGHVWQ